MRIGAAGFIGLEECEESYMAQKRAPTSSAARRGYSRLMNDGIYFADAEVPFHVWVRESAGTNGFRWVLREAPSQEAAKAVRDPAGPRSASQKAPE
jgi:hypothetical protein